MKKYNHHLLGETTEYSPEDQRLEQDYKLCMAARICITLIVFTALIICGALVERGLDIYQEWLKR